MGAGTHSSTVRTPIKKPGKSGFTPQFFIPCHGRPAVFISRSRVARPNPRSLFYSGSLHVSLGIVSCISLQNTRNSLGIYLGALRAPMFSAQDIPGISWQMRTLFPTVFTVRSVTNGQRLTVWTPQKGSQFFYSRPPVFISRSPDLRSFFIPGHGAKIQFFCWGSYCNCERVTCRPSAQ